MADWIARVVARRAQQAVRSADSFHAVAWEIDSLDIERRRAWNEAKVRRPTREVGRRHPRATGDAKDIARARYALWKNPGDLTGRQRHQLDWIAKTDTRLWRAYLLKGRVTCSPSKATKARPRSIDGRAGRAVRGPLRSCTSNARSQHTGRRSTPHS